MTHNPEYEKEYRSRPEIKRYQKEYHQRYKHSEKFKKYQKEYRKTLKYKEQQKKRKSSEKYKNYLHERSKLPEEIKRQREYRKNRYKNDIEYQNYIREYNQQYDYKEYYYENREKISLIQSKAFNKRKRNFGFNILYENILDEPFEWHHINNNDVVALPVDIHKIYSGFDSEIHRENLSYIVDQLYKSK